MKRLFRGILVIVLCISVVGVSWTVKRFVNSFFSVKGHTVQFHGSFSEKQKNKIARYLSEAIAQQESLQSVESILRKKFPSIKTMKLLQAGNRKICVFISSIQPRLLINTDLVFAQQFVFKKDIFDAQVIGQLERVDFMDIQFLVQSDNDQEQQECIGVLPEQFVSTMESIPHDLFDSHRVLCQDKTRWWLQDRQQGKFLILFNGEQIPGKKYLCACNQIKKALHEQGEFSKKVAQEWVADIRFDDQIILFAKAGGR